MYRHERLIRNSAHQYPVWEAVMAGWLPKAAMLIALAVALGYLLAAVPNVEAISAVSFFSGYLLGAATGALVGALSILLFSVLNPLGPAFPAVVAAQVLAMGSIGACGHVWRRVITLVGKAEFFAAAFGAVLTLAYGVLADYGFAVSMGRWRDPLPVIAAGLPFSVIHIVSNGLIFGGASALVVRKYPPQRSPDA
jgi:hypothetical protein